MDAENNLENEIGMKFSPKKYSKNFTCCVVGCLSTAKADPRLRFHKVPKYNKETLTENFIRRKKFTDEEWSWYKILDKTKLDSQARICSLHFVKDDYSSPDIPGFTKCLKVSSVPTVNLPSKKNDYKKGDIKARTERMENRSKRKSQQIDTGGTKKAKDFETVDFDNKLTNNDSIDSTVPNFTHVDKSTQVDLTHSIDKGIQVNIEVHLKFLRNKQDLKTMTGIPSFTVLELLVDIVQIVNPTIESKFKDVCSMSLKDRIVLTFMKLKQNISYQALGVMFQMKNEQNVRRIFLKMIHILSNALRFAIVWPKKQEVLRNIPLCFKEFSNVRAVIDVIEINIEKPKNLCCQIGSYSSYKSSNTVRFMTAVSPGGIITFLSKPYAGRTSDKAIFEDSKFITFFEKGDALMADKGFLIDDQCLKAEVELVRPPFLKNKKQFTEEEAVRNAKIAKARVYIERSNQRIKVFKILSSKVPSFLVGKIEQIFIIICAIVNMSSPILSDEKFHE